MIQEGKSHGVTVQRLDFSDPQGRKGACDHKAATVKAHIRVHLNEGQDMETASQMVEAMQSSGGVPDLNVSLCERVVPPSPAGQVKLDGVSTVANVGYGNTYIRLWNAYGIGPGKKVPLLKINIPANFQIARLSAVSSDQELCDQFSAVTSRKASSSIPFKNSREDPPPASLSSESSELYACPEEGCRKSYQRYASRLDGRFTSVPQFGEDTISADAPARQSGLQTGLGSQTDPGKQSKILSQAIRVLHKENRWDEPPRLDATFVSSAKIVTFRFKKPFKQGSKLISYGKP